MKPKNGSNEKLNKTSWNAQYVACVSRTIGENKSLKLPKDK